MLNGTVVSACVTKCTMRYWEYYVQWIENGRGKINEVNKIMNCYGLSLPQLCFKLGKVNTDSVFPSTLCEIFDRAVSVSNYVDGWVFIKSWTQICVLPRSMAVWEMEYIYFKTWVMYFKMLWSEVLHIHLMRQHHCIVSLALNPILFSVTGFLHE